jgi:hypothetical protein
VTTRKAAQARARRERDRQESPREFARRIGLDLHGGEFILWDSLPDLAYLTYWRKRAEDSAASVRRGEAPAGAAAGEAA